MTGLILLSHGSLLCGAAKTLREHAERLRRIDRWESIEIGFLNYNEPRFYDVVEALSARGIRRIVVVPYFLVSGKFVTTDLPREIARSRAAHPHIEIQLAEPISYDAGMADAVLELAREARGKSLWTRDLARAASFCEANARCPLFHTPECPQFAGRRA